MHVANASVYICARQILKKERRVCKTMKRRVQESEKERLIQSERIRCHAKLAHDWLLTPTTKAFRKINRIQEKPTLRAASGGSPLLLILSISSRFLRPSSTSKPETQVIFQNLSFRIGK